MHLHMPKRGCVLVAVILLLTLWGCASFQPPVLEKAFFQNRAQTKAEDDVRVTAAVLSAKETQDSLGFPLYRKGVQPVWLEIENKGPQPLWFLPASVDRDYFAPLEVAYMHHSVFYSKSAEYRMDRFFSDHALGLYVAPGSVISGFVFTHMDKGTKAFNVDILRNNADLITFTFFISVPGLKIDHHGINFETLYSKAEIGSYDEQGFRKALADMPCCTANKEATRFGDPLNLVVIGDIDDVYHALIAAGWDETETIHGTSIWKTGMSFIFGSRYRYSPVSALYVFGRAQDAAFQKARGTIHERNHLRLWLTPMRFEGQPVWVGQISRDVGVRFYWRTITTHKIDPDVDETRVFFLQDLLYAQSLKKFGYAKGVGAAPRDAPRNNLAGDPYFTDSYRIVLWVSGKPVSLSDVDYVDWEEPPER